MTDLLKMFFDDGARFAQLAFRQSDRCRDRDRGCEPELGFSIRVRHVDMDS